MLADTPLSEPCDFVLFGTLGDLACRKLIPALYQLERAQLIHPQTRIIACAQQDLTFTAYADLIETKVTALSTEPVDKEIWSRLLERFGYCQINLTQQADYKKLLDHITPDQRGLIVYFAIPPTLYAQACQGLSQVGLNQPPARIVIEKPLGHDLESSQTINDEVARFYEEEQIYRIDHYLGKETVLNLLVLRFANSIFSSNWDRHVIDKVKITVAEEIGVEQRWGYYDQAGQVRDMLQNHVLQILSLVAMDPP